ncbi:MAG: lactate utilization protein [Phoenicibacter congonensis]|uniref:Lactate utilization protein n=1 Tax=Phoenicibacter congonensis TaxID=1944646 RepID=A0AA43RKF2_9ACTN|nr:lactate utilization protein [Phoenicibacter congonensis]
MGNPRKDAFAETSKTIIKNLEKRGMDGYFCESSADAVKLVKELVPVGASIGWGGTETFRETGVKDALEEGDYEMLDRSRVQGAEALREMYLSHLGCDVFFMSTNALTTKGELVNIDGNSNRLACLLYGPKQVIVLVGMNKIVHSIEDGINRIQTLACPPNATRLHCDTPCANVGVCGNCHNDDCMCCNIVVTRHNRHKGRVKVILIAEDLGF